MKRSTWKIIAILIGVVVALGGFKFWQISSLMAAYAAMPPLPTVIATDTAQAVQWQPSLQVTGSVVATQKTQVSAELAGVVKRIAFASGEAVPAGAVLVELDSAEEKARLDAAIARAELADVRLQRERKLIDSGAISRSRFDESAAEAKQAAAEVATCRAIFNKKTIRAPFAGRVSIRDINLGDYLAAGAPVVELQAIDPVYVDFTVAQQHVALIRAGEKVIVEADTQRFTGAITAMNPDIDAATRNLRVRATVANGDERLRPGMYVQVALHSGTPRPAVAVPATALRRTPHATSVFVVEQVRAADGKSQPTARERFVDIGPAQGDRVVLLSGVKPGEQVVIAGVFKLRDAMPVTINNSALPPDGAARAPANS